MYCLLVTLTLAMVIQGHGLQANLLRLGPELSTRLDRVNCSSNVTFFSPPTNDDCAVASFKCFKGQADKIKMKCSSSRNEVFYIKKIIQKIYELSGSDHSSLMDCVCKEKELISYETFKEKLKLLVQIVTNNQH